MDVEAAASAVESWRLSEDEAEAAEAVRFANSLLSELIHVVLTDSTEPIAEVNSLILLTKSPVSVAGAEVIVVSGVLSVPSACPHQCISTWRAVNRKQCVDRQLTATTETRTRRKIRYCMLVTVQRGD